MKKLLLIMFAALCIQHSLPACDCLPVFSDFCSSVQVNASLHGVVVVRKTADYYYGMQVERLYQLGGQQFPASFIVWGDNGGLCRIGTGAIAVGDTLVMALHPCDLLGNVITNTAYPPNLESAQDFVCSACGIYTLQVQQGLVSGYISDMTYTTIPLQQFVSNNCTASLGLAYGSSLQAGIWPNPATDLLYVNGNLGEEPVLLEILSADGRLVHQYFGYTAGSPVALSDLAPGVYLLRLQDGAEVFCRRFIKS